jgi:hypothetical protein
MFEVFIFLYAGYPYILLRSAIPAHRKIRLCFCIVCSGMGIQPYRKTYLPIMRTELIRREVTEAAVVDYTLRALVNKQEGVIIRKFDIDDPS